MSKPVVFVIGASGNVGAATVAALSEKYSDQVEIKAGVRNPDADKASKLKALPNVEIIQATMGDSNLVSILSGVTTLYIVTPGVENRAQLAISTAESAKQAGVKHIAVASMAGSDSTETLFQQQFNELETNIAGLGINYTIIRLPGFTEEYLMFKPTIASQGVMYRPTDPTVSITSATNEDIGKASATILVNPEKYIGQTLTIVSNIHSLNDFIKEMSEALGKEIKYVRVPKEAFKKGMIDRGLPEWVVEGAMGLSWLVDTAFPGITQGDLGIYKKLTGEEPTSLKQWVAKNAKHFK